MLLGSGTRIGSYEIIAPLGAGGMGEVYRAHDSKLHRDVAIKVISAALAQDGDRLARFEREARTLASLNHPNIAHVYGLELGQVGQVSQVGQMGQVGQGSPYLVMELVEGPTLADRIAQGALPFAEALPIATQIATALDAAHEQGIIHRDLKPANIKLRPDGTVKVLDFGLAKTLDTAGAGQGTLVTMTSPAVTQAGIILGTAAYMSPEQARGKPVDKRTDIWAFGCVLFEMLAGRTTFDVGDTVSDAVAAVLKGEPQWSALPPATPNHVRTLLQRCLHKDSKQRIRDIGDVLWELEQPAATTATTTRAGSRAWLPWSLASAAVLLAVAGWWRPGSAPEATSPLAFSIVAPPNSPLVPVGNLGSAPLLSPDGMSVLYRTPAGAYVRRLDSLEAHLVAGSANATSNAPFWSADSTTVYFPTVTELMRVRLPDGAPEVVTKLSGPTRGGSVSDTGTLLITQSGSTLFTRSTQGGEVKPVEAPGMKEGGFIYPEFLPDSEDLLFHFRPRGGDHGEVYLATLQGTTMVNPTLLMQNDTAAGYSADGRIWFVKNDNLYAQRLNRQARTLDGEPELVTAGVASQPGNTVHRADFSVARNGTVAWRPGKAALARITVLDREGRLVSTAGPPGAIHSVLLSPDEARLLATGGDLAWVAEPGQPGQLNLPRGYSWIAWSADGSKLRGRRSQPGPAGQQILERLVDGAADPQVIGEADVPLVRIHDLSPDGTTFLADDGQKLYAGRISGTAAERAATVLADALGGLNRDARFSPDGRWIVYDSDGLFVQPFPGPGRRRQIGRGTDPVWRRDAKEIVYLSRDEVWSVPVTGSGADLNFGAAVRLFGGIRAAPGTNASAKPLAVSRDGSRFFIPQALEQPEQNVIHIMLRPRQP